MASGTFTACNFVGIWILRGTGIAFIDWIKLQIQGFATMFRNQVCHNNHCTVAILSWHCSCWERSELTSISCPKSFLIGS